MFSYLKEKLFLTEKGLRAAKLGTLWCTITNLVSMAGIAALYVAMYYFIEHLTAGAELPGIAPFAIGLALFFAVLVFCNVKQYEHTYGDFYDEITQQRLGIAEHLRKLPLSFFGRRDVADLTETVLTDVATMEHAYSHVLGELMGAIVSTTIMFAGCLFFNWQLAIAAFWSVPVAFVLLFATRKPLAPVADRNRAQAVAVSEGIQETLDCVREIRATNQEEAYLARLDARIDEAERMSTRGELLNGLIVNSSMAVLRLGVATTLVCGAALVAAGSIDFMVMFAFLLMVSRIYAPFDQSLMLLSELFIAEAAARRMKGVMDEPVMEGSQDFHPEGHDIVFDHVAFSYAESREDGREAQGPGPAGHGAVEGAERVSESARVLEDVSFTAKEGQVTALVGPSGSGKSTCARLAARMWDATDGTVHVGGVDVAGVDPETLLADYAVVFQDVMLFDDTVMGNIRLGRRDATDEEVLAAARAAMCDDFMSRMPQGYQTMIGENGSRLSGGERQRISIARALLKDAPIVLLDEATASLDVESESQVQAALSRLLAGKTVLVIAHRMRTVLSADKIVVLRDGRVAEAGSPDELLARGGEFARMVKLQSDSADWSL